MNLNQLKIFKVVAELGSISKTADTLFISQPSVSKTITSLEAELDIKLFDRVGRTLILNDNGMIVLKHCNDIFSEIDNMKMELSNAKFNSFWRTPINFYAASNLMSMLAKEFHLRHPNIKLYLSIQPADQFARGNRGRVAIYSDHYEYKKTNTELLFKEKIFAAVPTSNPLSKLNGLSLNMLTDEKIIMCTKDVGIGQIMNYFFKEAKLSINKFIECSNINAIIELLPAEIGITFIPEYSWGNFQIPKNIVLLPILNPQCESYIYITWGDNASMKPEIVAEVQSIFLNYIKKVPPMFPNIG